MSASNIQVAIKVRPILRKEKEQKQSSNWKVAGNSIQLIDGQPEPFYFDKIFDQDVNNQLIFDTMAKQIVDSGLKGFNGTIFAYGQTSSGKTYTMMGDEHNPGVMVLASKEIFKEIEKAADRQFLVRVGYIEIYNEKIYDLLNKSNQDLKIHETPNGDVSVNCSEYIITCEADLLSYLCMGSKSRKIGETNMNERSSRSHAIFRIIIESRKTETDEDSVQISILNLVDLAGSERADQTGATGSRLKEGGHINKSLLFLSRVIKQLAEDKYVSYRDSKLTRILQASLGGNALTAIICTVNPTAVEETLSTLSFANRAKAVKNTPQVNEVLTDAAMMKRLEKEINRLQNELEVEKTKNSQIKVGQLQKRLNEEVLKIINSNSSHTVKAANEKRRRTWCPSSAFPPLIEESGAKTETCLPHPMFPTQMPTKLQLPKSGINFTPHITLRDVYYQNELKDIQCTPSIDEEFMPAEDMCFDTPKSSPTRPEFHTPKAVLNLRTASLTPRLTEKESLQKVERELKELEAFTNLENKLNVDHDTYTTLKYKLENAERIIGRYEKEREDFAFARVEHVETETKLANCQKRSTELETQVSELQSKIRGFETSAKSSSEQIVRYEKEVTELKTRISQLEMENREAVSLEVEFDQHKTKSKRRETELLDALEEKQKEINKLQRSLQTITVDVLNQSREEVKKMSRSLNESDPSCAKCEDYKLVFAENEKLTKAFEELNSSFGVLKQSLEKTSSEAESAKLRADYLATENGNLKKEAELLKALNGNADELQAQITGLQKEKCKLESVKIEFEVMSKEIANKIAEKISISQEIENLNSLKSRLSAECEKVQTDLSASGCLKDGMEKLRSENQVLHSELQTIKLKLESTQSECTSLMTENQYKSDNYEKLNSELLSVQTLLHTVQSEYHDIQLKYEQIQAECNKHEGTIGEIQSEYKSIQKKYQSLQQEYEKLENDSVQSIADCDRVQNENENLETEIRDLKTKVEEAQRKLLENDSLQLELESLKSEMNRLQDEYDRNLLMKRKSASPSKEENEKSLREENAKLKGDLMDLQQRFNEMQTEYDDISTQLVDTFADYETLQGEVARLEAELEQNKTIEVVDRLSENFKTMQCKTEQLEAENTHLLKENVEWKKTMMSMSESMRDKCDEREQLVAQLEQVKNESMTGEPTGGSKEKLEHFLQLTESFVEIDIPTLNGSSRRFKVTGPSSLRPGNRMTIGAINEIVRGSFNEMRGAIEFAVSAVETKSDNEIYDSLDVENNSMSGNSCDSLEAETKTSNNRRIRELVEEKSEMFEKLRSLEEALAKLKNENAQLRATKEQLIECEKLIEQLNEDKMHLHAICDENNCKMSELNEIISRAESDNKKLIVDCEQLKETVESEAGEERDCYVSRECYAQLQLLHEQVLEKQKSNDEFAQLPTLADIERELRSSLKGFNPNANEDETDRVISQNMAQYGRFQDQLANYEEKITNLERLLSATFLELKECLEKGDRLNGFDVPTFTETKTETCKCAELQAALEEKSKTVHAIEAAKTEKYERDICSLLEQLKQQECKYQEFQIEIIELRTSLEEKAKESAEHLAKFEELHGRYAKLQSEHDELQKALASAKIEESDLALKKSEERFNMLQANVKSLEETIITLENEREELQKQKESIEEQYQVMEAKSAELQQTIESVGNAMSELCSSNLELKSLEEIVAEFRKECLAQKHALKDMEAEKEQHLRDKESLEKECNQLRENAQMHMDLQMLENEKRELMSELEILRNSERSLHGELQRLVQENELAVRDKEIAEREYQNAKIQFENTKEECAKELLTENERLNEQLQKFAALDGEKEALVSQLDALKNSENALKLQMEKLQEDCTAAKNEVERLENVCLQAKDDVRHWKRECEQQEEHINKIEAECRRMMELKKTLEEEKSELETLRNSEKNESEQLRREMETLKASEQSLQDRLRQLQDDHEIAVREKGRLDNENSQSKILVEQLSSELSARAREIEDLVQAKSRLESEVETLTAEHDAFQKSMLEKCALVTENLEDVSAAKVELIAAVEKANKRAEQISKENKDIEDKYKAELNALSKTKDTMSKEIDALQEKLSKAEEDLKTAISGVDSEKNKLISKLTDSTSSLTAQNSELEDKLTQLEQQLEELKEALSTERILKENLDKNSSEMENVIADLNNKNLASGAKLSEMDTQMVDMQRELQETQRKLQAESNLKDVLEKANAERDDLIVSLTNNNNSLARRAKDLEEKLAILGNQFEESKRHLSTEVAKLNQLLTQANEMNLNQSSRIEDLTFKVTELQGELERTEKAILERDSLLLKLDQLQAEYDTLSVKHANLELTRSSFDAELNSARAVVLENTALNKQLNEVQSNLKELEHKCSELNSANEALHKTNVELAAQLKDTSQQATKCNQLNEEIGKLKTELEKTRESLKEEQDRTSSVLKSKEREFAEQISNFENSISSLKAEKQVTQEKLENLQKTSSSKIADMERHVQCLQKEMAGLISKTTISPRREKAIDHLMGENHQLKVKNMSLMDKLDSCSKSQNEERKNRRLSTHDERRMQSFWETNRDVCTMTDPTSVDCNCSELDRKLNEIKQKLLIRDSQVNTLNMELKNHPLKTETATLKKMLLEEESKQQHLRQEVKKYKQLLMSRTNESKACSRCADHAKKIFLNSCTQTIESDESESYRKLAGKYEDLKMICRGRHAKIKELEDALSGKENSNVNFTSLPSQQYRQKYELLKKEFKIVQEKYEEAKLLCNRRYEEIKNLTSQLKANS